MSRILVFESDPDLSSLFSLLLEDEGHEVHGVTSLSEAEEELSLRLYHLVLLEASSDHPGKSTLTTTRNRIRQIAPTVPAMLCSCSPGTTRTTAAIAGFEGFLPMPFDVEEARIEVQRVIAAGPIPTRFDNDPTCRCS